MLISYQAFLRILAVITRETHYWLEYALSNLFIEDPSLHKHFDDCLYFKTPQHPFPRNVKANKSFRYIAPAAYLMVYDPATLVYVLKSALKHKTHNRSLKLPPDTTCIFNVDKVGIHEYMNIWQRFVAWLIISCFDHQLHIDIFLIGIRLN
jgi:hypothetical protein